MTVRSKIILAGETACGLVRQRNEDNFCLITRPGDNASLAVVADGIGGQRAGDLASYVCCRMFLDAWKKRTQMELSVPGAMDFLQKTVTGINAELFARNRFDRSKSAMGTTVVCAVFLADKIVFGHAGDSRLYVSIPGRGLTLLTHDHTVARLIEEHRASPAILGRDTLSDNTIFQALGISRILDLEIQTMDRPTAARYLLCSDGLSKTIPDKRIGECMEYTISARHAAGLLMRETLLAGAPDNVSVICGFPQEQFEE